MKPLKFVELFAGIGGFGLGFQQAADELGLETRLEFACEIDSDAAETYRQNFHFDPLSDVRKLEALPEHDILLAGFPCPSFSYAGGKKGFGDTRGTLFFEIMRLIDTNRPKAMILENVRGITTNDGGRTLDTIRHEIDSRGYSFDVLMLNSVNFGVPQNRVRVYMICIEGGRRSDLSLQSDKGPADSNHISSLGDNFPKVKDIIMDMVSSRYHCSQDFVDGLNRALHNDLSTLHGRRFIDYRGGHSIHSWEMGSRGICSVREMQFMNQFILERRNKKFGSHRDGKMLTKEQISTFWDGDDLDSILENLLKMKYLKIIDQGDNLASTNEITESSNEWRGLTSVQQEARRQCEEMKHHNLTSTSAAAKLLLMDYIVIESDGIEWKCENGHRYKPVAGNYSFEVYKCLDPEKISVTVVASDCSRLGVYHNQQVRRLTPREVARLQGFPEDFKLHRKDSKSYFQLGNAVTVPVAKAVCIDVLQELLLIEERLSPLVSSSA